MAQTITTQIRSTTFSIQAVAEGNFDQKMQVESAGEFLLLKETVNNSIDEMATILDENVRIGSDVTRDGVLGGLASVEGLQGRWEALADNTNAMAQREFYSKQSQCILRGLEVQTSINTLKLLAMSTGADIIL
jgi:osomolarity two-component system sensor histidine kinase NIK1